MLARALSFCYGLNFEVNIRWSGSYFLVFLVHAQLPWILHHVLLFSMLVFKQTILLWITVSEKCSVHVCYRKLVGGILSSLCCSILLSSSLSFWCLAYLFFLSCLPIFVLSFLVFLCTPSSLQHSFLYVFIPPSVSFLPQLSPRPLSLPPSPL